RFFRLFRHGDRPRPDVRPQPSLQFRPSLSRDQPAGFLAPLAYDPVAVSARLPLYPAGRKPAASAGPSMCTTGNNGAWRAVAWRRLELRPVGWAARHRPELGRLMGARAGAHAGGAWGG